jgi:hypothetical protein
MLLLCDLQCFFRKEDDFSARPHNATTKEIEHLTQKYQNLFGGRKIW